MTPSQVKKALRKRISANIAQTERQRRASVRIGDEEAAQLNKYYAGGLRQALSRIDELRIRQ